MSDWLVKWIIDNLSNLVSAGAFAVSLFSLWYSRRRYNLLRRVQLLRPHSDRLSEIYARWISINGFVDKVLDTTSYDIDCRVEKLESDLSNLKWSDPQKFDLAEYAVAHLKSGYSDLYQKIINLRRDVKSHNENVLRYVLSQCYRLREELGLPDWHGENRAYYSRIVWLVSRKILFNEPNGEPYITFKEAFYFLKWGGADLVITEGKEICEKGLKLIEELIEWEEYQITAIRKRANDLRKQVQKLREEARIKLIDFIRLGALVKGECDVCKEM